MARDADGTTFRDAVYAHAELGRTFGLPVIMSTSAEHGRIPVISTVEGDFLVADTELQALMDLYRESSSSGIPTRRSSCAKVRLTHGTTLTSGML